ncbi:MAG: hypothetical protein ACR2OH_01490 [Microthrixaceae bacterium]
MTANLSIRLLLVTTAVLAAVGLLDAAFGRNWDLVVVFCLVLVVQVALWARLSWGRTSVAVRRDLVFWLRERAVAGGESVEHVADRAIGAYRAGLVGDPDEP